MQQLVQKRMCVMAVVFLCVLMGVWLPGERKRGRPAWVVTGVLRGVGVWAVGLLQGLSWVEEAMALGRVVQWYAGKGGGEAVSFMTSMF